MLRNLLGAVVGYVVIAVTMSALYTVGFLALGAGRVFQEGSWEVSSLWVSLSLLIGFGAAVLGGLTAAGIGRSLSGPAILAVVILVLGVGQAIIADPSATEALERTVDVGVRDAATGAVLPPWLAWVNPVVGIVGVFVGGRLVRPKAV